MKEWVTITEYAVIYAVSRPTVYKWMDAGLLETFQVEHTVRVKNRPPVNPRQSCQAPPTPLINARP
jgi:hypothetical protein